MGLKNFTVIPVTEEQRVAIVGAYRTVRNHRGDTLACRGCGRATTRPSGVCSGCAEVCKHQQALAAYIVVSSGAHQPKAFCLSCGRVWIVRKGCAVLDVCLEDRTTTDDAQPCSRCGTHGGELHHWAPQAIFADAEWWPKDYLCVACHRLWHQAMRAAAGYRLDDKRHVQGWDPSDISGFGGAA